MSTEIIISKVKQVKFCLKPKCILEGSFQCKMQYSVWISGLFGNVRGVVRSGFKDSFSPERWEQQFKLSRNPAAIRGSPAWILHLIHTVNTQYSPETPTIFCVTEIIYLALFLFNTL